MKLKAYKDSTLRQSLILSHYLFQSQRSKSSTYQDFTTYIPKQGFNFSPSFLIQSIPTVGARLCEQLWSVHTQGQTLGPPPSPHSRVGATVQPFLLQSHQTYHLASSHWDGDIGRALPCSLMTSLFPSPPLQYGVTLDSMGRAHCQQPLQDCKAWFALKYTTQTVFKQEVTWSTHS